MDEKTLKFLPTHEWIEGSGKTRKVGISFFAQEQLGDIVFIESPEIGKQVAAGAEVVVVESCKATSGVYAPLPGTVKGFNTKLGDEPGLVNASPYANGWLFEIEVADNADESKLMDHAAYTKFCSETA